MSSLSTGKSYYLVDIFNSERRVCIPDMQRDYCWATTKADNNLSLVELFLQSIKTMAERDEPIRMGIFYAYEYPTNLIQLCDGQQRMTSLYLILGVALRMGVNRINFQTLDGAKMGIEISKLLVNDEDEPRLQYAIRETTLYFLKDLVSNYFLGKDKGEIRNQLWYALEYDLDPTVINLVEGVKMIGQTLEEMAAEERQKFADFVAGKMSFLYFDMINRRYGEEQYVVINTTGRNLTTTENLKPAFLSAIPKSSSNHRICARKWEKWEDWIWTHRNTSEQNGVKADYTVDNQFRNILIWKFIIDNLNENFVASDNESPVRRAITISAYPGPGNLKTEEDALALFEDVQQFIDALDWLEKNKIFADTPQYTMRGISAAPNNRLNSRNGDEQADMFRFLTVVSLVYQALKKGLPITPRDALRAKQFFKSRAKMNNITKDIHNTLPQAIIAVRKLIESGVTDISAFGKMYEQRHTQIFSDRIVRMLKIIEKHPEKEALEEALWELEDLDCVYGYAGFLFDWPGIDDDNISPDKVEDITNILKVTIEHPTDLLRRALMASKAPCRVRESYRYNYGEKAEDFATILFDRDHPDKSYRIALATFLNNIKPDKVEEQLNKIVDDYIASDRHDGYDDLLIREPKWLGEKALRKRFFEQDGKFYWISNKDCRSEYGVVGEP